MPRSSGSNVPGPGTKTVATCTAAPLLRPLVVTTALRLPAVRPLTATVKEVSVAAVTVPVVPPGTKTTELLDGTVPSKPLPLTTSVVAVVITVAVLSVTVGGAICVNNPVPPVFAPPGEPVMATSTVPEAWAPVTPVMVVASTTEKLVNATPPTVAPVAPRKPVPVIVTLVPPAVLPLPGLMLVTAGASTIIAHLRRRLVRSR